jgi:hypothetical protein
VRLLDPQSAALYAIIGISLVLIGALLTPGSLSVEQRGPVLAGIVTVLFAIGWRIHRLPRDNDKED